MSDSRDTNRDGKVSLVEKVKGALPGHKDNTTHTHTSTQYVPAVATGVVPVLATGVAAIPVAVGTTQYSQTQTYTTDSRDLNRDGHVSLGEKVVSASSQHSAHSAGAYDSRDVNRDGHVSTGEAVMSAQRGQQVAGAGRDEIAFQLHEEQLAISKRQVEAGEVGIHKHVQAERVEQTVALRREEVIVERRPLSGIADPNARIMEQDEILRVPLHREEVIMEKRVVPTEEVIVRKKEVIENQTVGATLRSEYVDTVQTQVSQTGAYADSRDLNRDGHVSVGEKLKSATGSHVSGTSARG